MINIYFGNEKKEPFSSLGFNNYPQKGILTKDKGIYNKIMNQVKHLLFSQKKKKNVKHLLLVSLTGKVSNG